MCVCLELKREKQNSKAEDKEKINVKYAAEKMNKEHFILFHTFVHSERQSAFTIAFTIFASELLLL